jgi:hypothetical protein
VGGGGREVGQAVDVDGEAGHLEGVQGGFGGEGEGGEVECHFLCFLFFLSFFCILRGGVVGSF